MKKKTVRVIAVAMAVIMAASILVTAITAVAGAAPSQTELDNLKDKQSDLKQQMQDLEAEINSNEYDQFVTSAKKALLDEKVALTQQEIQNITDQIFTYETLISEKEAEVAELEEEQAEQWELYKVRIRAMEENGPISYYAILFGASSFTDMLMRLDTINAVMDYDKLIYDNLIVAQQETEAAKADLEETKAEMEGMKVELQDAEELLITQQTEAAQLLVDLEQDHAAYEQMYDEMVEEQNSIMEEIEKMEEEIRNAGASSVVGTGSFIWPAELQGRITSFFGWRDHPILHVLKYHAGIDIGSLGYGANVVAADGGTVVTSATSSSYGEYVVISHGNGYSTLYAHMSKRLVSKGDTVSQGDVIGIVGSTGLSSGPHLHFEIWSDGDRIDPLNFFSSYEVSPNAW